MINFNTDLADERRDIYRKANRIEKDIPGIETEERTVSEDIKVATVKIINNEGANAIGKPIGTYITVDIKKLKLAGEVEIQRAADVVTEELKKIFSKHIQNREDILVVGLGNAYVTPDSLRAKSNKRYRCYKTFSKIYT